MGINIAVSVFAKDLVASGPGTIGADPSYSNLQTTAGATGYEIGRAHV